jgi:4-aminobutyrate aminotransferase-like enzyme
MSLLDLLAPLRAHAGTPRTVGLDDATVLRFAAGHPDLVAAISHAAQAFARVEAEFPELLDLDEAEQIRRCQAGLLNFYPEDAVNPYVALAARGPWLVTLKGAVVYDCGGYGMLGFGHTPEPVLAALAAPQAMANVMTPNLAQLRFERALRAEIGHHRGDCPYTRFLCLNSGSESVSLAGRIADVNSKLMTDPGAPHAGRVIRRIAVKGGFHGRTELPALYSDSSRKTYREHLGSYARHEHELIAIEPYDIARLEQAFADAEREGWHIEAMFVEPVMGEGDPGRAMPRAFYEAARRLTREHGTLLLVDSIQAGLRAHGTLSILDYPGFEGIEPPDMETYSKALNAAQVPLSVLAVTARAAALYRKGTYGNTMSSNPRALDVASATLGMLTPALRQNIRERGAEALRRFEALKAETGGMVTRVQGTGLLFSCELAPRFKCFGTDSIEEWLREHGLGVIHGGANSLRFTPHFGIGADELDLVVGLVARALREATAAARAA